MWHRCDKRLLMGGTDGTDAIDGGSLIFADGFESDGTGGWSSAAP